MIPQIFNYDANNIRVVAKEDGPWFVGRDVCEALEIDNSQLRRLEDDEKGLCLIQTPGGDQSMICINEAGLYELILGSRAKKAKAFKRWVKHDVLPSIRKHGAYMTPQTLEAALSNPDTMITVLKRLKKEQEEKAALLAKIDEDKPRVLFAQSLEISDDTINVNDLAKLLKQNGVDIGEVRLFKWMRDNGYLIKSGSEYNMPTQRSMDLRLFEIKVGTRQSSDGTPKMTRTPKVTGRGQMYFINKFKQQTA